MAINKISGNILADNLQRGTNLSVQGNLIYFDVANDRVGIVNSTPASELDVVGVLTVGNVTINSAGNINVGNAWINDLSDPVADSDAATKSYVDNSAGNVLANLGNITIANTTISATISNGNITLAPTDSELVIIDTTSGLLLPVGNTAQRPSPVNQGTVRYNTDLSRVEVYDGSGWEDVVANVTNQTLNGDGSTTVFVLDRATTTAAALIMINGIVQLPTTAYSITGNSLTFTQAPVVSDVIDIRFL